MEKSPLFFVRQNNHKTLDRHGWVVLGKLQSLTL